MIDGGPHVGRRLLQVLHQRFIAQHALERVLDLLGFRRIGIERWNVDVGHLKHDAFACVSALGSAGRPLRGLKHRGHGLRRKRRVSLAFEVVGPLDLQLVGGREISELGAAVDLFDHLVGFGAQLRFDFALPPACLDLVLDLIERPVTPRRNARNLVPHVAATLELQRVVLRSHSRGECVGQEIRAVRHIRNRVSRRIAAGPVDGIDRAVGQVQLGRDFIKARAGGKLVFHLVGGVRDGRLGPVKGDLVLELGFDVSKWLHLLRFNLVDVNQGDAEAALDRIARSVCLQRKRGIGDCRVDNPGLGDEPQIDVGVFQSTFLHQRVECGAFLKPLRRLVGFFLIGKDDLLQIAPLGGRVARQALVVGAFDVRIRYFDALRDRLGA